MGDGVGETATENLAALLAGRPTLAALEAQFDHWDAPTRVGQLAGLGQGGLAALWEITFAAAALGVGDLIPGSRPSFSAGRWVCHAGLPGWHEFENYFYQDEGGLVWGRTQLRHWLPRWAAGAIYLGALAHPENAGQVMLDYSRIPQRAPPGWPELGGGPRRITRRVLGGLKGDLRRLSPGVIMGRASWGGQCFAMVHWDL